MAKTQARSKAAAAGKSHGCINTRPDLRKINDLGGSANLIPVCSPGKS
jgi:hypothetical protein